MGIGYIRNQCVETKNNGINAITDAPSFVLGVAPLGKTTGFSISRFVENRFIIGLDFVSNNKMCASLGRIAHFVERMGKTQLLALDQCIDGECAKGEGYDFRLSDIAHFYNQALVKNGELSSDERKLLDVLLQKGLLKKINGSFIPLGNYAIVGMSREYNLSKRRTVFIHEYSHALYFVDPKFRALVSKTWNGLGDNQKILLRGMMIASGIYSSGEQWLIETEAQAHAIALPEGKDGFINLLIGAYINCNSAPDGIEKCRQFLYYRGSIRSDLKNVHGIYKRISECRIPLLSAGYFVNGVFAGDPIPCKCNTKCTQISDTKLTGQELRSLAKLLHDVDINKLEHIFHVLDSNTGIPSPKKWMEKIQNWFDQIHKIQRPKI